MAEPALLNDKTSLIIDFANAIGAYSNMLHAEDFGAAQEWLEKLAERWRRVAEKGRLEQLGEDLLGDEALQLLGALEDSLILCHSTDPERQAAKLELPELTIRAYHVGRAGTFGDEWQAEIDQALARASSEVDDPVTPPELPTHSRRYVRGRRERLHRARQLSELVEQTGLQAVSLYKELGLDGEALDPERRASVLDWIEWIAAAERVIDLERYTLAQEDWGRLALLLWVIRSIRRNLTLACAADPERRGLAMPVAELQSRTFLFGQLIEGATWEQGFERLMEAAGEQSEGA